MCVPTTYRYIYRYIYLPTIVVLCNNIYIMHYIQANGCTHVYIMYYCLLYRLYNRDQIWSNFKMDYETCYQYITVSLSEEYFFSRGWLFVVNEVYSGQGVIYIFTHAHVHRWWLYFISADMIRYTVVSSNLSKTIRLRVLLVHLCSHELERESDIIRLYSTYV